MASDRRIKANRANARKSTGPRSPAGKKRASRNALRHGLTAVLQLGPSEEATVDALANLFADAVLPVSEPESVMPYVREIARWEFELEHIRRTKLIMLEHAVQPIDPGELDASRTQDHNAAMTAEAVWRTLPELRKFSRYEQLALRRRDRAMRLFILFIEGRA
jgi:hypothetical protein